MRCTSSRRRARRLRRREPQDGRRVLGDELDAAADAIRIEVEGARVRLGGSAASTDVRDRALRAVRSIAGVAEVDNRIAVAPSAGGTARLRFRA